MNNIYARQGDLVFSSTTITGDLEKKRNIVLAGNDTAPHTVKGEVLTRTEGLRTLMRIAKKTQVIHDGRHLPITLAPGDYEVYPLRERHGVGDRPVVD